MKKIFLIATAALALAACDNNEDNPVNSSEAVKITASIEGSTLSRAVDETWSENDTIGISSTVGSVVGPYKNVKYTTSKGDGKFTGRPLFFYKPMTLTAYYPFTGVDGTALDNNGVIEANTRLENQSPDKQPYIDFLWDSQTGFTAADPNVNFKFAHKMSKVTFIFQSSPEVKDEKTGQVLAGPVDVENMVNYTINGLVLDGTFDTSTGVCAVKDGAQTEDLSIDVNNVKNNKAVLPLILFPQTLAGGSTKLHIYTNELGEGSTLQHYVCSLTFSDGEILSGTHYVYTIQVTKIGLIVGKMTIEPWVKSERFIISTIDGNVFEK